MTRTFAILVLLVISRTTVQAQSAPVRSVPPSELPGSATWYAFTAEHLDRGTSLRLGAHPVDLTLRNGWRCEVRPGLASDARIVTCVRGEDRFSFSVACDAQRPKDHVQVRLSSGDPAVQDVIEVGCEIPSASGR